MFDEKGRGRGELVNFGICGLLFLGLVALIPLYTKSTASIVHIKYIEIAEKGE
jgi:hypothetical protein